jgi:hypothetical protein
VKGLSNLGCQLQHFKVWKTLQLTCKFDGISLVFFEKEKRKKERINNVIVMLKRDVALRAPGIISVHLPGDQLYM